MSCNFNDVPDGQRSFDFNNYYNGAKDTKGHDANGKRYSDKQIAGAKANIAEFEVWCVNKPSGIARIARKFLEEMANARSTVSGVWLKEELRRYGHVVKLEGEEYAVNNNHEPILARVLAKSYPQYGARIRRRRSIYDVPEVADLIPTLDILGVTVS